MQCVLLKRVKLTKKQMKLVKQKKYSYEEFITDNILKQEQCVFPYKYICEQTLIYEDEYNHIVGYSYSLYENEEILIQTEVYPTYTKAFEQLIKRKENLNEYA